MCKVFIMSGVSKEANPKAVALMKTMAGLMSVGNSDGIGYAAIDEQGSLFGERWHTNTEAFPSSEPVVVHGEEWIKELDGFVIDNTERPGPIKGSYNFFGQVDLTRMRAITLHTRMATSGKEFKNTHPFHDEEKDTSLIHNGVIRNTQDFKFKLSTCDSESILIAYLEKEINKGLGSIQSMANMLTGYYACGVFSRDADNNRILDVFKANGASLNGAYIKELDTVVYSTSLADIKSAAAKVKLTVGATFSVKDAKAFRIDPFSGKIIDKHSFKEGKEFIEYKNTSYQNWDQWNARTNNYPACNTKPALVTAPTLTKSIIEYYKQPSTMHVMSSTELKEFVDANRGA